MHKITKAEDVVSRRQIVVIIVIASPTFYVLPPLDFSISLRSLFLFSWKTQM